MLTQQVLCLGLFGNVIRFLYVAMLTQPWLVLPFELMQGNAGFSFSLN